MAHDKFNRKSITVAIPDGISIANHGIHNSNPESVLNSVPEELTPAAIDILLMALELRDKVKAYNLKKAATTVKIVRSAREEWKAAIEKKRAEEREREERRIEDEKYRKASKEEKRHIRKYGCTSEDYMKNMIQEFKKLVAEGKL